MKTLIPAFFIFTSAFANANELLDILEGKIDPSSVSLPPPLPEFESVLQDGVENPIYLEPEWAASPPDLIWSRAVLYDNSANPFIQQVAMMGYSNFQATFGDTRTEASEATPSQKTDLDNTRTRRARLGARIRAFNNTEMEAIGEFAGDANYRGVERLKATTQLSDSSSITYGKFTPLHGTESRTEVRLSPYPQPSMINGLIAPASSLGVSYHRTGNRFNYDIGWFSGDFSPDIPKLQGPGLLNLAISKTSTHKRGDTVARTRWHADYSHNFDPGNSNPAGYNLAGRFAANGNQLIVQNPAYRHLFSTGLVIDTMRYSFNLDFQLAKGSDTVWGYSAGASYWALPGTLKLVARYQYAESQKAQGIAAASRNNGNLRFDDSQVLIGDQYHSLYMGANLHLYKDNLIIHNGLEYSVVNDDLGNGFSSSGYLWHSGVTISF